MLATAQYPGATLDLAIGSDGAHWFSRSGYAPRWIIIHGTAGGAAKGATAAFFKTGPHSTHYAIEKDGTIVQCVPEEDAAWANAPAEPGADPWWAGYPNPNFPTLSIEHVKASADNSDALTPEQEHASCRLVQYLCRKWDIPARPADQHGGITGHYSICPVDRRNCPGTYPWASLWRYIGADVPPAVRTVTSPMPYTIESNGDLLFAPSQIKVTQGFAIEWQKNQSLGEPLDKGRPTASGSLQLCESGVLLWDGHNVGHVILPPAACHAMADWAHSVDAAQSTITDLKAQLANAGTGIPADPDAVAIKHLMYQVVQLVSK